MKVSVEQIPDKKDYYAFLYGPIVLAASTGTEHLDGLYADDSRGGHIAHGKQIPLQEVPMLIGIQIQSASLFRKNRIAGLLSAITERFILHKTRHWNSFRSSACIIPVMPFHFRQASEEQFKAIQEEMATAERKATELANQTIDLIFPGEQQPESDHGIQYEQAETGTNKDRHFRRAKGWFG